MGYRDNGHRDQNRKKFTSKASEGGDSAAIVVNEFSHIQPVQAVPLQVIIHDMRYFDRGFRTFKSLVQKERIMSTFKERQRYEKPSQKRRRKKNEMKRKIFELEHPREKMVKKEDKQQ